MSLVHGASTQSSSWTTSPDPFTFSHAGGTSPAPVGALVLIYHGDVSSDLITNVSYGGAAMTRVASGVDTATEPGRVYAYFLGSGVLTGTQTVSIDHTATSTTKRATCITVTSTENARIEAVLADVIDGNVTNPQIQLDTGARNCLRYCALMGGLANVSDYTPVANMSTLDSSDAGQFIMRTDRQTNPSSGAFTIGYTASTDDVAMVAIAIGEMVEWYGTINLLDQPRASESVALADGLSGIDLITDSTGPHTITVPESVSLSDGRTVQLVSAGGAFAINCADAVTLSDAASAAPVLPLFDMIMLSDAALVQRLMTVWYGTANLVDMPTAADTLMLNDGRIVAMPVQHLLTISVGEQLVNLP